jgi:hypothetical protein
LITDSLVSGGELSVFELAHALLSSFDDDGVLESAVWHAINVHVDIYSVILGTFLFLLFAHRLLEFSQLVFLFFCKLLSNLVPVDKFFLVQLLLSLGNISTSSGFLAVQFSDLAKDLSLLSVKVFNLILDLLPSLIQRARTRNLNHDSESTQNVLLVVEESEELPFDRVLFCCH